MPIEIIVRSLTTPHAVTVAILPSDMIRSVKEELADKIIIQVEKQILIFEGKYRHKIG